MVFLRAILYASFFGGLICVVFPLLILRNIELYQLELGAARYVGLLPLVCGMAVCMWCIFAFVTTGKGTTAPFDPPRNLVVSGLFRFSRNPLYIGGVLVLIGESLLASSWPLLVYTVLITVALHLLVVFYEEPVLGRKFGREFEEYKDKTPRWLLK